MRPQAGKPRRLGAILALVMASCVAAPVHSAVRNGTPASEGLAAWTAFQGCAAPETAGRRVFYLDPVHGEEAGTGTQRHPWPELARALRSHGAELRGGDVLLLLSGDHGDVRLDGDHRGWVKIMAAPGASPILRRVRITGEKWDLAGLTFRDDHPGPLVGIDQGAHDIVVENSRFLSADDAAAWTPQELNDRGATGLGSDGRNGTRCLTIRDNSFRYVDYGVRVTSDKTVLAGNFIDNFGADAVDFHGSDMLIAHNVITNAREAANNEHPDAIQGFQPGGAGWDPKPNAHVTIEGNLVIRQTDPKLPYPEGMQGIDAFDGDWTDLKVVNNVVVTNAFHGIFFSSVHGGLIANNTVLSDATATENHPPNAKGPMKLNGQRVWIGVGDRTHQGGPSNDVILRNNIAQSMQMVALPGEVKVDHNLVYHQWFQARPDDPHHPLSVTSTGDVGDHNRVDLGAPREFVHFDPATFQFDLHLRPRARAVGSGDAEAAPKVDIEGRARAERPDIGAYAFQP